MRLPSATKWPAGTDRLSSAAGPAQQNVMMLCFAVALGNELARTINPRTKADPSPHRRPMRSGNCASSIGLETALAAYDARSTEPAAVAPHGRARTCSSVPLSFLNIEAHALGQRKLRSEVDRVSRPTHIRLPGVRASFAAATRLLLAAKSAADLRS